MSYVVNVKIKDKPLVMIVFDIIFLKNEFENVRKKQRV